MFDNLIVLIDFRLRCPPGHYCVARTQTQFQYPCPDGEFSTKWGLENRNLCVECNAGYTCTGGDPSGDKLCPLGHYCLRGKALCPVGQGTGTGNISPCKCPAGKFTEERGATRECKRFIVFIIMLDVDLLIKSVFLSKTLYI